MIDRTSIRFVRFKEYLFSRLTHSLTRTLSTQEASRRDIVSAGAAAAAAAFLPAAANAAVGESPRFSVFGLIGDGTSYSEGAAYGTDQSAKLYSPYSVYGDAGVGSVFDPTDPAIASKKQAVLTETKKRLDKLPKFIAKKAWFEVTTELDRYMGETREAVRYLATTPEQKKKATAFFKAIEATDINARRKNQDACAAAQQESIAALAAFVAAI